MGCPETLCPWGAIPLCCWLRNTQPPLAFPSAPQVMGNRRSDEPTKTKKGLSSFLDAARWNRGEPQGEVPSLHPPRLPHTAPHGPIRLIHPISHFSPRFSTPQSGA